MTSFNLGETFEISIGEPKEAGTPATVDCSTSNCVFLPIIMSPTLPIPAGHAWTSYYYAAGNRIAMRVQSNQQGIEDSLYYLLSDHLGSTALTLDEGGNQVAELRYSAWGETRYTDGETPTQRRYTGQLEMEAGLYFYNARYYDPELSRWTSPDSIVADPYNPLDWDRYNYVRSNPLKYIDSDGHNPLIVIALIGAVIFLSQIPSDQYQSDQSNQGDPGVMALGLMLMTAPAFGPGLCLNDGDCTNEFRAASNLGQELSKDGDPFNEVKAVANTGKTLIETMSKTDARKALTSGIEGLTKGQTQKALEILGKGKVDSVSIGIFGNGNSQVVTKVLGGDGGSFVRYVYTVDPTGKTIGLIQYAYDKAGELIHVHDKFTNAIIK